MECRRYHFLFPHCRINKIGVSSKEIFVRPSQSLKRRGTIVLDLDETLVSSHEGMIEDQNIPPESLSRFYEFADRQGFISGMKRPYVREFLLYCRSRFEHVFVWTAGEEMYAKAIVQRIFTDYQPDAVYHRGHCESVNGNYRKPLRKIYNEWKMNPEDVLFLDNNNSVFETQDLPNLVHIPDYIPNWYQPDFDQALLEFVRWSETNEIKNIRITGKDGIFSTPVIQR